MKTFAELVKVVNGVARLDVEFKPKIEDLESYPEGSMRGTIVLATEHHDEIVKITFDYTKYDAHNAPLEKQNYYDKNGVPNLTAREAGQYKPVEVLYFMETDLVEDYFSEVKNDVYDQYQASGSKLSYVQWLEEAVKELSKTLEAAGFRNGA